MQFIITLLLTLMITCKTTFADANTNANTQKTIHQETKGKIAQQQEVKGTNSMKHLALIMDGNRRWAREHKFKTAFHGYDNATNSIHTAIKFCIEQKIKYLSLFALSSENLEKRTEDEKNYLWDLMIKTFKTDSFKLVEQGICIKFVGDRSMFPEKVTSVISNIEEKTKNLTTLHLNILFCYGGRQEILAASQQLAADVLAGKLKPEEITEQKFKETLWCGDIPDPEILIRTGKRSRTSNFLTFQSTYTELFFPDCYWPELTSDLLQDCVNKYNNTQRNFGV